MSILQKMMAIAGRDLDGIARGIRTDKVGNVKTTPNANRIRLMDSGSNKIIPANTSDSVIDIDKPIEILSLELAWREGTGSDVNKNCNITLGGTTYRLMSAQFNSSEITPVRFNMNDTLTIGMLELVRLNDGYEGSTIIRLNRDTLVVPSLRITFNNNSTNDFPIAYSCYYREVD